jgi:hypothetical protein
MRFKRKSVTCCHVSCHELIFTRTNFSETHPRLFKLNQIIPCAGLRRRRRGRRSSPSIMALVPPNEL